MLRDYDCKATIENEKKNRLFIENENFIAKIHLF